MTEHENRQGSKWLLLRYKYITATDVAKLLGLSKYLSRSQLIECKIHLKEVSVKEFSYTEKLMKLGTLYEREAEKTFRTWADKNIKSFKGFVPDMMTQDWLSGTPDFIASGFLEDANKYETFPVEFKCHFYPTLDLAAPMNGFSNHIDYYLQLQTYIEITNSQFGLLWSWTKSNGTTCFKIIRDSEMWEKIKPFLYELWKEIKHLQEVIKINPNFILPKKEYRVNACERRFYKDIVEKSMSRNIITLK